MDYIYLIGGIVLLLLSGNWLVKSGLAIAEYFRIPPFIVGVTVISLGTSAPELFVSLNAAISGSPDIAIGNIIGSNIANIGLVLAITAIVINIPVQKTTIKFDFPVLIIATALFTYFMFDLMISRTEGIIMLGLMLVYILLIVKFNRNKSDEPKKERRKGKNSPIKSLIIIVISCVGLLFGSNILVEGTCNIASSIGISERVISITVIAFGTSIPELATSVIAAFRKQIDISVGNIIGSNIFNILVISGITSTAVPLKVNQSTLDFDIFFLGGFVLLMGLFFIPFKIAEISRWKGLVFLLAYFTYYLVLFYH
ncbi:MAG: sodium:calcium antiporter [Marinilabiliales bacterium]|nr:MAG: sodium:calcium antiporter [Marinilabiliales bacterium]